MGATRSVLFSDMARSQSSLQADDYRRGVGDSAADVDNTGFRGLSRRLDESSLRWRALSDIRLYGPAALDVCFECSFEQQLQPRHQCPPDNSSLFFAIADSRGHRRRAFG